MDATRCPTRFNRQALKVPPSRVNGHCVIFPFCTVRCVHRRFLSRLVWVLRSSFPKASVDPKTLVKWMFCTFLLTWDNATREGHRAFSPTVSIRSMRRRAEVLALSWFAVFSIDAQIYLGLKGVLASKGSCNKLLQTQRPTRHKLLTCFCSVWSIRQTFSTLEPPPTKLLSYNSVVQHGSKWAKIKMSAGLCDLTNCFTSTRPWAFLGSQPCPLPVMSGTVLGSAAFPVSAPLCCSGLVCLVLFGSHAYPSWPRTHYVVQPSLSPAGSSSWNYRGYHSWPWWLPSVHLLNS